jgi:hypothetical protein
MNINGVEFQEECEAGGHKSPESQYASDSGRFIRTLKTRLAYKTPPPNPKYTNTDDGGRHAAAKALLGFANVQNGNSVLGRPTKYLSRAVPAYYPPVPDPDTNPPVLPFSPNGVPFLWATSIPRAEPMGKGAAEPTGLSTIPVTWGPTPVYDAVRFTVEYNALPYYIYNDAFATTLMGSVPPAYGSFDNANPHEGFILGYYGWESSRYIAKYIKPAPTTVEIPQGPPRYNRLTSDPATLEPPFVPSGLIVPVFRAYIRYVWMNVPYSAIPFNTIAILANTVNQFSFDRYPPGTLKYLTSEFEPGYSPLGYRVMNVAHNFLFQPNWTLAGWDATVPAGTSVAAGHNAVPRVYNGQFYWWPFSSSGTTTPIQNDPFGIVPYKTATFNGTEFFQARNPAYLFAPDFILS